MTYEESTEIIIEHMKDVILMTNIVENAKFLYDRGANSTRGAWAYHVLRDGVRQLKTATDALEYMLEEHLKMEETLGLPANFKYKKLLIELKKNALPIL